jgi:hypothetical protein
VANSCSISVSLNIDFNLPAAAIASPIVKHELNMIFDMHNEVSLAISVEKMPQSLLKFICWLIDEKAYKAVSEPYTVPIDKIRKILAITELDAFFLFQSNTCKEPSHL